ncbi:1-deoxy-D-xylulose-5-phosphate synthase [Fervidobacterium changbaicum]|uniref:1-deoxy-D-xylulose-5-phosphate synthase n=1 Tax=Fervidobacterium changbaicum TaxID=310769 RepID=A0ABX5QT51_9BACT|nr:1-deoxy-D-xylulose-5-phosphate synthase [Fervidobacterium changbaicum]QAV33706.1 1-deoxy-D-xylulose-5-phosphate synthase [Fervidobacterium changbaicum]SDH40811.1 1-deoxy-D-xylulose-5-phosphate synthase [Fervidobacterium changbaicum]
MLAFNGRFSEDRTLIERIRKMNYDDLYNFAEEIRKYMIDVTSVNGGHLASNLGTVELTLALYRIFDPYEDYIIWDTGHQTYTHKLLTGRWDAFKTLRTFGGISGFTNIFESPVDRFGAGHVGTSIAAALGIEKALKLQNKNANVVVVIGDGALTSGQALEALNQIKSQNSRIKIILNSNGMSISKNVGGLSQLLEALRTSKIYVSIKEKLKKGLNEAVEFELKKIREALKVALIGDDFFESLGVKHFGPIDGHDLKSLEEALKQVKDYPYPTVLSVFTIKGKGYHYSEQNPTKYHGVDKFDPDSGTFEKPEGAYSYSEVFGTTLMKIALEDDKVVALTAAMPDGTGLSKFAKQFPERFVDLGITEQSVVTYAGGLAAMGFKPVVAIYSTFLQRAYDQIIHDIALQDLDVVFAIDRAGLVGTDGPTHHGVFDIAYLKPIPNIKVLTPLDGKDLACMLWTVLKGKDKYKGPIAIRYPRDVEFGKLDEIYGKIEIRSPFKWEVLVEGKEVALLAVGVLAKKYTDMAKTNGWTLIGVRSVKPMDKDMLERTFQSHKYIFTIEEGTVLGGFGETIAFEYLQKYSDKYECQVEIIGIQDEFIPHGTREELIRYVGLDSDNVEQRIKKTVSKGVRL